MAISSGYQPNGPATNEPPENPPNMGSAGRGAAIFEINRLIAQCSTYRAEIERLREALEGSRTALNDWVATYASDMCAEKDVAESQARITEGGGTLAYIAAVTSFATAALNTQRRELS